jgi:3-carboxy-cis,cis-muconate cycloisomerase
MADGLFDGILARGAVAGQVDDAAWLQAMLDFEAGLAAALAGAGLLDGAAAAEIGAACRAEGFDVAELGRLAASTGNPAAPLVRALTDAVGGAAAGHVHRGATSQDVLDTAAMLVAARALEPLLADLRACGVAAGRLAADHRGTVMAARTLLQQAVPTTFGLKAAGWMTALDAAADRLDAVREHRLAVQLGGAAGTLATLADRGPDVLARLAAELGLAEPVLPWHTDRTRIAELAGALGAACGVLAKVARDVVLLAQTEVAEVREGGEGRGGSSTMPHKRNPVGAVSALACAQQAPGLVATLLGAMAHEHERAAGPWQAEWRPLRELLVATGSAAAWGREVLEGLEVDAAAMRANLDRTGGLLLAERVATALAPELGRGAAHDRVAAAAAQATASGRPFAEVLAEDPVVRPHLEEGLLDPAGHLGSAGRFVDRALRAHSLDPEARA